MALSITYVSWSLGSGYQITSSDYTLGQSGIIQALSGTVVITANDVGGTVTEVPSTIYHSPSASYSYKVFKNTYANNIYSTDFDITYSNPNENISQVTSLLPLLENDKIYFELTRQKLEYSASVSSSDSDLIRVWRTSGQVTLADNTTINTLITGSGGSFIENISNNTLCLTSSFNNYYSSSQFIPTSSSLYNAFGEGYELFYFNYYDYLITKNQDGIRIYEINAISTGSNICVTVEPSFGSETIANLEYIVFLRKKPDETRVIVNYQNTPGQTSYGFIVPINLHPEVLKNIDIITKEVKQKLIELNNG